MTLLEPGWLVLVWCDKSMLAQCEAWKHAQNCFTNTALSNMKQADQPGSFKCDDNDRCWEKATEAKRQGCDAMCLFLLTWIRLFILLFLHKSFKCLQKTLYLLNDSLPTKRDLRFCLWVLLLSERSVYFERAPICINKCILQKKTTKNESTGWTNHQT